MNRAQRRRLQAQKRTVQIKEKTLRLELRTLQEKIVRLRSHTGMLESECDQIVDEIVEELAETSQLMDDGDESLRAEAERRIDAQAKEIVPALADRTWKGVTSNEQARDKLAEEVCDRMFRKRELILILSFVDKIALEILPDAPPGVRGEDLKRALATVMMDPQTSSIPLNDEIRKIILKNGWRGATEENYRTVLHECIAERIVELQKKGAADVVLERHLHRMPPAEREVAFDRFKKRLEDEYEILRHAKGELYPKIEHVYDPTSDIETVRKRDPETAEKMRALHEAVSSGGISRAEFDKRAKEIAEGSPKPFSTGKFDQDLMLFGRDIWEETYKLGMNDEAAHQICAVHAAAACERGPGVAMPGTLATLGAMARFSAAWAVHAFQRIITSHTYAAALMCSDADREALSTIEEQWKAFMVIVPNRLLKAPGEDYARITVATFDKGAEIQLVSLGTRGVICSGESETAASMVDLLTPTSGDLENAPTPNVRALIMAKRLVAGLLLAMQHPQNLRTRDVPHRVGKPGKREADEPAHRIVTVGGPIKIDCRESVAKFIERGVGRGGQRGLAAVQWLVRGHYRRQVCGTGRLDRKTIWIKPHWAGREDAPIFTRPKKVVGVHT
jgi:hypothetical protein